MLATFVVVRRALKTFKSRGDQPEVQQQNGTTFVPMHNDLEDTLLCVSSFFTTDCAATKLDAVQK